MKKNFKYTILFIFIMIVFTCRVNAGVSCDSPYFLNETTQAANAKFNVLMPICNEWHFQGYNIIDTGPTYPQVKAYALEEVEAYMSTTDNKSTYMTYVPRCDDTMTMISAKLTYDSWFDATGIIKEATRYVDKCTNADYNTCVSYSDYCTWVTPQKPTTKSKPGQPSRGTSFNYDNSVQAVSAKTNDSTSVAYAVADPYCRRDAYYPEKYLVQDAKGHYVIDHYECQGGAGYTYYESLKLAGEKMMSHKCYKQVEYTSNNQCIRSGYHYSSRLKNPDGSSGRCEAGASQYDIQTEERQLKLISRTPEEAMDDFNDICKLIARDYDNNNNERCKAVSITYFLHCPLYKCDVKNEILNACTPTFRESSGAAAYCVNPSDPFSTGGYYNDPTFDVTSCKNSFNTVDCGYANILIEGNKHGFDEKAIELAMRLWGVHTGQGGFGKTGLSNVAGATCSTPVYYMRINGVFPNVYQNTYAYMYNSYFSAAHEKITSDGYLDPSNFSVYNSYHQACVVSDNMIGVACGDYAQYQQAVALLFNTILGNPQMKDHLYGDNKPHEPINAELVEKENNEKDIIVRYESEFYNEVFTKHSVDRIDCKKLKKTDKFYNDIMPYCQVRTVLIDASGNEINIHDDAKVDECRKNIGCIKTVKLDGYAPCSKQLIALKKNIARIRVEYIKSATTDTVNKYISCSGGKNQLLYSYIEPDDGPSSRTIEIDKTPYKDIGKRTFEVSGYLCDGVFCNKTTYKDINNTCSNNLEYDKAYSSSIKDPSLKCIVNMKDLTAKEMYDYSDWFNVNTDLCRIYCSDEVKYVMADKVKERSGRFFIYNMPLDDDEFKKIPLLNGKSDLPPMSSVVREKRTCVSEIYYNKFFPDIQSIKERYNLTDDEISSVKNWQDLSDALYNKARNENYRGENINQIIYDLYNCNLFKSDSDNFGEINSNNDVANGNTIKKPKDNKTGNVRNYISGEVGGKKGYGLFSPQNNYGLTGCSFKKDSDGKFVQDCVIHENIRYDGFAPEDDAKNSGIVMGSIASLKANVSKIKYCRGSGCFDYKNDDPNEYDYGKSDETEGKYISKTYSGIRGTGYTEINVPTNDYAYFDIIVDVGFFNDSLFEVEPDTAVVHYQKPSLNFIEISPHAYPVDKDAYNASNVCKTLGSGGYDSSGITSSDVATFNKENRRCLITQSFSKVKTFFRNYTTDDFMQAVNDTNNFNCYVDVMVPNIEENSTLINYINVDLYDMHPDNVYVGDNWKPKWAQEVEKTLESHAQDIITKGENSQYLNYSIVLNPQQIKNLKEDNKAIADYKKEYVDIKSCSIGESEGKTYYYNCRHPFLDKLRLSNSKSNDSLGTLKKDTYKPGK